MFCESALRKELETMRNADEAHYIRNDRNFSQEILVRPSVAPLLSSSADTAAAFLQNDSVMTYSSFPYVSYPPGPSPSDSPGRQFEPR